MKNCPGCGGVNQVTAKFCSYCGYRLPLAPGELLQGRYRVVRLLGQGGMGAVYQAQDGRLGNLLVAVKENTETSAPSQAQFEMEATTLAKLSHPNLPRVTDHFVEPSGRQYLVMDYVDGEDLQQKLDQHGCLPELEALRWMDQVCAALEYLHSHNPPIIHRDIKPANIKITPDGKAMLVDFGIAKIYRQGQATVSSARAVTSGFSPPEQYGGVGTRAYSDVYALGATLYTLVTGQTPPDAMDRSSGADLVPPRKVKPNITASTEAAIVRAMSLQPNQRPQSITELRHALAGNPVGPVVRVGPAGPSGAPYTPPAPPIVREPPRVTPPPPVATTRYATAGNRFAAALIDGLILMVVIGIASVALYAADSSGTLAYIGGLVLWVAYYAYFYSKSGQTPGKQAVSIRVVAADGSPISTGRAIWRCIAQLLIGALSLVIIGLFGYLSIFWDARKQTWYDKMAGTLVIRQ